MSLRSNEFGRTNGFNFVIDDKCDGCNDVDNSGGGGCDDAVVVNADDVTIGSVAEVCSDDLLVGMGHP